MKKILTVLFIIISAKIYSQNDIAILNNLISQDSSSVPTLFSYPDSTREAILIASTYPQGFIRLEEIQKTSSESFKKLTSKYNQSTQKQIWEITRYPELPNLLIQNKEKNKDELKQLLSKYPDQVSKSAINFSKSDYTVFIEMENIRKEFETKYKDVVKDFPKDVKKSFNNLLKNPELVTILSSNIKTTITLGDIYKRDPAIVKHAADSINKKITAETNAEYEEWKNGIKKDEGIQKDLKKIANQYERDNYSDDIYNTRSFDVNIYTIPPYPYWVGYPYWQTRPYWYPYPWWYNSGFYWSTNGSMLFLGMPTYNFGWWYYNHPHYHNRYPRATNYFQQHYQSHSRSNQGFNRSIGESRGTRPVIKGKR